MSMCTYYNPKLAALNQWLLRICYCFGAYLPSDTVPLEPWMHWISFSEIYDKVPEIIRSRETQLVPPRGIKTPEEVAAQFQNICLKRIPNLGKYGDDYVAFKTTVVELIREIQRSGLPCDGQWDSIDRAASGLHWFRVNSLTGCPVFDSIDCGERREMM